jgi:hypothetical protein
MLTSERTKWFALAPLCAVQFMVILDVSIVNVALPSIQADQSSAECSSCRPPWTRSTAS